MVALGTFNRTGGTVNLTGTLDLLPVAPSELTATYGEDWVALSWVDNAATEAGYKIERSTDGVNFTQIGTVGANVTTYYDTGLNSGTNYYYRVRAYNQVGDSPYSNNVSVTPEAPGSLQGPGLLATYYNSMDLSGAPVLERVDPQVNFTWPSGSPDPSIGQLFSTRWVGQVEPQFSETYTFYTLIDNGVRLWVGGQLVIDDWINQPPREDQGTITLVAGQKSISKWSSSMQADLLRPN